LATSIRVLVVDDFEPFRRVIRSILQENWDCRSILEASDGAEAVKLARELKPDLVLLDIGLPILNGIDAARQIREFSPKSKVLFVSENRSWDIAQQALSTEASGYVVKSDLGSELVTAVKAVLSGEKFIGSRLAGHDCTGTSDG
jgi:DNA-binding NarL/FixJ family response regulator